MTDKAPEQFAEEISKISDAVNKLLATRLKFDTIVLLVSHASKVGKRDVEAVLLAAANLEKNYLKPKVTPK